MRSSADSKGKTILVAFRGDDEIPRLPVCLPDCLPDYVRTRLFAAAVAGRDLDLERRQANENRRDRLEVATHGVQ